MAEVQDRLRPSQAVAKARAASRSPRIYYLHPLLAGPIDGWGEHLRRCAAMGFDHVLVSPPFLPGDSGDIFLTADHDRLHPALAAGGTADAGLRELAAMCKAAGLTLLLDLVTDRIAIDGVLAKLHPDWFRAVNADPDRLPDPRRPPERRDIAWARLDDPAVAQELTAFWALRLGRLVEAGVGGFRCDAPHKLPVAAWRTLIDGIRKQRPGTAFLAWTAGLSARAVQGLAGAGFDGVVTSAAWWDCRKAWLVDEYETARRVATPIAFPEPPFGDRLGTGLTSWDQTNALYRRSLALAAATGSGLLVPMGFEFGARRPLSPFHGTPADLAAMREEAPFDLSDAVRAANTVQERLDEQGIRGEMRLLSGAGAAFSGLLRLDAPDVREASRAVLVLVNPDLFRPVMVELGRLLPGAGIALGPLRPLTEGRAAADGLDASTSLQPGEVRVLVAERAPAILLPAARGRAGADAAVAAPRIVLENPSPCIDGGRFPAKRIVGESLDVEVDVFSDGHEMLAVELQWRPADASTWQRSRMQPLGNDRWRASMPLGRLGRHEYTIEAWWDVYGTFVRDFTKKQDAYLDLTLELEEGRRLLAAAAGERKGRPAAAELKQIIARFRRVQAEEQAAILQDPRTRALMTELDQKPFKITLERPALVEAERTAAGFASWFEIFPRSQSDDPDRHGTFLDVIPKLPHYRGMGFDVLYFPPIHPIGQKNRKGRNNSLTPTPSDPGSPYAIGSPEGGHDAIHPELGTLDDFRQLREAAAEHGLELALDFAINSSPNHPWLQEHPGWFAWRPDGTIKYAENPPKKYEDIVNVDFYAKEAMPDLWLGLRDVILHWVEQGVKTFRVDNPHTKPLPFWEWMIGEVRGQHPDVIFLSEAFTRPKVMYRLAKVGFSQSYTYFTWRNTKRELTEYLTELTTTEVKDFFRPHFFVNTPDINPIFLQTSGRAGFLIRAALAATLSGLWGVYNGFELCESAPMPGKEEYLDSEKYEIRVRPLRQPGDIVDEITRLNQIRKAQPALRSHLGIRFYAAMNDNILYFGKALAGLEDMILVAISLDPHAVQEATFELPLWEWGLPDHGSLAVEDLMREREFTWYGKLQSMRLDPADLPFAVWRVQPSPRA